MLWLIPQTRAKHDPLTITLDIVAGPTINPDPVDGVDGTLSVSAIGQGAITYQWHLINGPEPVVFSDANAETPTVTFSKAGTYIIGVDVSDDSGDTMTGQLTTIVGQTPAGIIITND